MQQRCIPNPMPDLLLTYGAEIRTENGYIRYFNKRSRRCLQRALPAAKRKIIERYFDCYLIEGDDGTIVTVGHRYRRLRHRD